MHGFNKNFLPSISFFNEEKNLALVVLTVVCTQWNFYDEWNFIFQLNETVFFLLVFQQISIKKWISKCKK